MTRKKAVTREMNWDEFFKAFPGEPLEALQRRHAEDVAWAEDHKDAPLEGGVRIRIKPGRPPKGKEAPIQVKAVKMAVAFWESFEFQAEAAGLTLHAAMRAALLEWASRHRASQCQVR
jgi:hypothetical protein